MKTDHAASHTPKELLDELKALLAEAEGLVAGSVSDHTDEALAGLRERFSAVQERAAELFQTARKRVVAGAHRTDVVIRDHPYQSITLALGTGLVIGVLLGRRCT